MMQRNRLNRNVSAVIVVAIAATLLVWTPQAYGCDMVTVSFLSRGSGIDRNAKAALDQLLQTQYPNVTYERQQQGREGEVAYRFELNSLPTERRSSFIEDLQSAVGQSPLVRVSEQ